MKPNKEDFLHALDDHKLIIFKVCNTYCSDSEDQKDLAQEIIIQLWQSFNKYDSQFKFSTWVYRISLNVAISYLRRKKSKSRGQQTISLDFVEISHQDQSDKDENLRLLRKFINELDDLNKALIIMYLDEKSHEEIAEVLNISKSNVGTKINRIKKSLREKFKTLEI